MIRMACFWMPDRGIDVDGDGIPGAPPAIRVYPDFREIHPALFRSTDRECDGEGLPGPELADPFEILAENLNIVSFEMDILDIDVNVGVLVPAYIVRERPVLSLTEALDAVFLMVTVMVPRLSGISTDGVTL